eukprot:CAMPEP_0118721198 /NCGR_PEP_ID=MMETSP0800-20121206/30580_1 /TAXON_ID=210618 ORGANISM="Striatella unipunctata, Strain CCMP2910" /NCGR_SAMPLE_ID=MMETSP0800 /ASSEMBLY_ACC=CAM_ASM_000638 /LENGTH=249 /DNA_ID=CAMNT_0006629017 /DNA_START=194 /DNA_END=940 /DNA_ORIENTATION=-
MNPNIVFTKVAPLPRTEWIKVAKSLPTKAYLDAQLQCEITLSWYFEAIEKALEEIQQEQGEGVNLCFIGHSIGGWVARAYLGGLSGSSSDIFNWSQKQCTSLVTVGTPHTSPEEALVDQTRGLLKQVESTPSCSAKALKKRGIDVTCVGSAGVQGKIFSTNVEELLAAASYLPLVGRLEGVVGDGIVPTDLAFMEEPARRVELELTDDTIVRHSHVVPTPWNLWDGYAPSIVLPKEFLWYGSDGIIEKW